MKQQIKENVSVDSTLQNHGYVKTSELWSGFWDFCDSPGTYLECQFSDDFKSIHSFQVALDAHWEKVSGCIANFNEIVLTCYECYCSLCSHCWFYDVTIDSCTLSECTYRPYRKEADDE